MWLIAILILAALMRLQNLRAFSFKLPSGYDPFYHLRLAEVIVKSGYRPEFDYYLNYPYGLEIGWLPLFDYILAAPGLLFGFDATVYFSLIFPVLLGVLNTFLIYIIAKRFGDENFALLSALVYATIPIAVYTSVTGFADHHVWNIFLVLIAFYLLLRYPPLAGIPLTLLAFSWLGAPIYAAVLALASFLHFDDRKLLYALPAFLLPAISVVISHVVALSFIAIAIFLILGIFVKRFNNLRVELGYLAASALALVILYFIPVKELSFVKHGISYLTGSDIYLPTIVEARSFDLVGIMFNSGYSLYFLLALISLIILRNRFIQAFFFASFLLSLLQLRFTEILAVPMSLLAGNTLVLIFERTGVIAKEENVVERKRGRRRSEERRGKKKVDLTFRDKAVIGICIAILLSPAIIISIKPYEMSEDWHDALMWVKENTEPTSYYLTPDKGKPEYSVLSWWDYGNWIVFVAKRPVVCNNFQAGAVDAARFFTAQNEEDAMKIVEKRGVRYVITSEDLGFRKVSGSHRGKFPVMMRIAGFNLDEMSSEEFFDFYNSSIFYRLHVENAENLEHFRLVKKFDTVKVFEVCE